MRIASLTKEDLLDNIQDTIFTKNTKIDQLNKQLLNINKGIWK